VNAIERIPKNADGECTVLHVVSVPGSFEAWLDTDSGICDGLTVGVGGSREEAIDDAITELRQRLDDLELLKREEGWE
jgi:hypothetical protein